MLREISGRGRLARLCNVPAHRLALSENVTSGCVLPLWGLPLDHGDHILISDCEHPGVVAACHELARRRQLQVHTLPVKQCRLGRDQQARTDHDVLAAFEQQLTSRTRLVVLSHLLWNTGQQMPIAAVAARLQQHPAQPYLLVDAAQSIGQIPVEEAAQAADIYAFTGHKWACGPEGLGGVALSERMLTEAQPTLIGWRSLQDETRAVADDPDPFHHDSRRFEVATSCVPLMAGLRCSLDLLDQEGSDGDRLERIRTLSKQLWEELRSIRGISPLLEGPPAAGLVSFQMHPEATRATPSEVVKALGTEQIWIRDLADPICLRACTHICTNHGDMAQLIDQIRTLSAMDS